MKPLRNINDLQVWAKNSDYRALGADNLSIEIKLNYFSGVELGSPQNGATAVTTTPTLRWGSYPGADEYKVRVWDYTGDTKGTQIVDDNTTDVEYTISPALSSSTKYLWQISQIGPIDPIQQPITVTISGGSTLEQNGTRQLSVDVTNSSQGVTWSSQNESIATVDSNGLVTYVSGAVDATVDIDAESVEDPTKSDTHTLTIVAESTYTAQDSRAGDEAFMQAFWDATQGDNLTVLASSNDLPSEASRLDKYKIGNNLWLYDGQWIDMGEIWFDKTGWVDDDMDLSRANIAGVTVDTVGGELRIVEFDMQKLLDIPALGTGTSDGNNLVGTLCPEWGNLTKCTNFNIKQNHFSDAIPDTVQSGSLLERISLGGQRGDIDLTRRSDWYEARHRGLDSGKKFEQTNEFSGSLPVSFENCLSLELIEIRAQRLTGTMPSEWGACSNMKGFFLNDQFGNNPIGGTMPSEWGSWTDIVFFQISNNKGDSRFTGPIPQSWQDNWTELANIKLDENELDGSIPDFPNTYDMRYIRIGNNKFADDGFPSGYFQGSNASMTIFSIINNGATGELPQTIPPITTPTEKDTYDAISAFHLDGNNFSGLIPQWVQDNFRIKQFQILGNSFHGPFPKDVAEQPILRLLWISGNKLGLDENGDPLPNNEGDLPDVTFTSDELYEILMSSNHFTGPIPASWESMDVTTRLWRWVLSNNQISGAIPSWIRKIPTLERIQFNNNQFSSYEISGDGRGFIVPYDGTVGFEELTRLYFHFNSLSQTDVDNIISDAANLIDQGYSGSAFELYLQGNTAPSSAVDADITTLQNYGVDLQTD